MPIRKTDAVVLNSTDWSNTSRIVSFYTPSAGVVRAAAKGARRAGSRLSGVLGLFNLVDLVYYEKEGRELQVAGQCSVRRDFPGIRDSLAKTAYCSYFVQLVDEFARGREKSVEIFQLLLDIFGFLEENDSNTLALRYFELNFLKSAGYGPALDRCGACSGKIEVPVREAGFSPSAGGVLCRACQGAGARVTISGGALATLQCLERAGVGMLARVQASRRVGTELKRVLDIYLDYYLEKRPRAREFIESLDLDSL